jgi:hypothetical protein
MVQASGSVSRLAARKELGNFSLFHNPRRDWASPMSLVKPFLFS